MGPWFKNGLLTSIEANQFRSVRRQPLMRWGGSANWMVRLPRPSGDAAATIRITILHKNALLW